MNFGNPSVALLAASGGDTVKLFDISVKHGDPCNLSYTPSPGHQVNSVKWNHTNLVVASAGEDKKISLWRKNGQTMGTIPVAGADSGDNIEEFILALSFSNKASRYLCSGGNGQVVRVWDLQRKRCIKWLRGHTSTITGIMYNCKDEHLASISLNGDLILHNLASGARAAELKDPNGQVLRVLDYSRISRHFLVTAGDDGTIHLWDTTGRSPKVSWLKQHSAPTTGINFSPSNDKIIASVGLDKKLYMYDSGSRKPSSFISYEAPFSSLAFRDDGLMLAAGTSNGRVAFYDVRGKPQPIDVLHAYTSLEAITSLCWQRSKPVIVNESTCTTESALVGDVVEESILMPDPLPSATLSSLPPSAAVSSSRNPGRLSSMFEASSLAASSSGFSSILSRASSLEETPQQSHFWPAGKLSRLHASRASYNFKDDMEVFSPLVDVQPITPSLDKIWDVHEESNEKNLLADRRPSSQLFPSSNRRFHMEDKDNDHPIFDWKSSSTSNQDETQSSTPAPSSKGEDSSITPPEAWGGEKLADKYPHPPQPVSMPSRLGLMASSGQTSGSMFFGLQDIPLSTSLGSLTSSNFSYGNSSKDISSNLETSLGFPELVSSGSMSLSINTKSIGQANLDSPRAAALNLPRIFSTHAERMSTVSSFGDGTSLSVGSPKTKKYGAETREELLNSLLSRTNLSASAEQGPLSSMNGGTMHSTKAPQPDAQQGTSFTLQLFQRTLEETLDSFQKSIHEDMRNLHIEILRQFHLQEMEVSSVLKSVLENQAELMKEVKSLRKQNQQLKQLL